jgi:hypothetical protein
MPDDLTLLKITRGEDRSLPRSVDLTALAGESLAKVWFTVKRSPADTDADAIFQKIITPVLNADGQINVAGGGSPIAAAHLFLQIPRTDTLKLDADIYYPWDIKGKSSGGAIKVLEAGLIVAAAQITRAES